VVEHRVQACRRITLELNTWSTPRGDVEAFGPQVTDPTLPRKAAGNVDGLLTVPETDSGGRVENTEAFERTVIKELGKLTP
jgi:hypothetical protein